MFLIVKVVKANEYRLFGLARQRMDISQKIVGIIPLQFSSSKLGKNQATGVKRRTNMSWIKNELTAKFIKYRVEPLFLSSSLASEIQTYSMKVRPIKLVVMKGDEKRRQNCSCRRVLDELLINKPEIDWKKKKRKKLRMEYEMVILRKNGMEVRK